MNEEEEKKPYQKKGEIPFSNSEKILLNSLLTSQWDKERRMASVLEQSS